MIWIQDIDVTPQRMSITAQAEVLSQRSITVITCTHSSLTRTQWRIYSTTNPHSHSALIRFSAAGVSAADRWASLGNGGLNRTVSWTVFKVWGRAICCHACHCLPSLPTHTLHAPRCISITSASAESINHFMVSTLTCNSAASTRSLKWMTVCLQETKQINNTLSCRLRARGFVFFLFLSYKTGSDLSSGILTTHGKVNNNNNNKKYLVHVR